MTISNQKTWFYAFIHTTEHIIVLLKKAAKQGPHSSLKLIPQLYKIGPINSLRTLPGIQQSSLFRFFSSPIWAFLTPSRLSKSRRTLQSASSLPSQKSLILKPSCTLYTDSLQGENCSEFKTSYAEGFEEISMSISPGLIFQHTSLALPALPAVQLSLTCDDFVNASTLFPLLWFFWLLLQN